MNMPFDNEKVESNASERKRSSACKRDNCTMEPVWEHTGKSGKHEDNEGGRGSGADQLQRWQDQTPRTIDKGGGGGGVKLKEFFFSILNDSPMKVSIIH